MQNILIWVFLVIVVIYGIYTTLGPIGFLGLVFLIIGYFVFREHRKQAREALLERTQAERRAADELAGREAHAARILNEHLEKQKRLSVVIEQCGASAVSAYTQIPDALLEAEALLDRAQEEFDEGAFSPFWEAIESVVGRLGRVDDNVRKIGIAATKHAQAAQEIELIADEFPIDVYAVTRLEAVKLVEQRMRNILRQAQKNFQFSTIYEQRKTTSVLIEGFRNLGEAISGLGDRVTSAVDTLSYQVKLLEDGQQARHSDVISALGDIESGMSEIESAVNSGFSEAHTQRAQSMSAQTVLANKQLDILDNIQRNRKPRRSERGSRI